MKTSMSRSTFKILFYVKKGSERANGYLPLMCRLTVDGEIKQFSCKLDVPPETLGRENGTCHGQECRGAENQCGD